MTTKTTPEEPEKGSPPDPGAPGLNPAAENVAPASSPAFPIVVVGASAGGVEAFRQLLRALASDTGMAFIFMLHQPKDHESELASLLARDTPMPVVQGVAGTRLLPNQVVIAPPNPVVVSKGKLVSSTREAARQRPIDHLMRSLAEEHQHKSIGVVLSGMLSDGSRGIDEIKGAGGITFAQDDSAAYISMPRSAVATGSVDFIMSPPEIARELRRISEHPYVGPAAATLNDVAFERIVGIVHQATGVDFANYKRSTLHRRITRRMVLHRCPGAQEYLRYLQENPREVQDLYQDVLIGVTSFFRNPEAYEALKSSVFPRIVGKRPRNEPIRVWALGCSTGEEAYSIAIAFTEYLESAGLHVPLQVFATDLNASGIDRARAGVYPKGIVQDLSPERLRRFFIESEGSYRVSKPVRDMCVFARQNLLSDPPFSRVDLIACRNLLIYMDTVLQQRVIPLLHYALRGEGFLWLGSSEAIGSHRDLFDAIDAKHKIYVRRPSGRAQVTVPRTVMLSPPATAARPPVPKVNDPQREADRIVLARYGPPGVVINGNLEIIQFRGDTSPYLAPAPGKASLSLLKMLREGLAVAVRNAITRVKRDGAPAREEGLRVKANGTWRDVNVAVMPLRGGDAGGGSLMVLFEDSAGHLTARLRQKEQEAEALERTAAAREADVVEKENARLRQELAATREYLQSVIEQQEAANEELQSANEEVQSANEELQSINEELETSKEEIQSSNEELATVNDELQNRNIELSQSNNDLTNLLASVQMAIVMVGSDLRIRRFTPAAEKMLNLIAADVGRPLGDIKLRLSVDNLEAIALEVIETVAAREVGVTDANNRPYLLRVRPYRTLENRIEGAVIMLIDAPQAAK